MDWLLSASTLVAGYLIGSVPFGYLVARARGVDIFREGSGNVGATNIGRVLGRKFGLVVFALDFAKGAVPVVVALNLRHWLPEGSFWRDGWLEVAAGLAAFLGHLYPVFLGFRGGKGVATGTGVVAVLLPGPTLAAFVVWLVAVVATRLMSLASLLAVAALCAAYFARTPGWHWADPLTAFCLLASGLVVVKHRANVGRLLRGNENRLKENPTMTAVARSLHVLAVGLWFGSAVFFTFFVALPLFETFEGLGKRAERPAWFPLAETFAASDDEIDGPKEQGSRAAGFAVTPLFPRYFLVQAACAFVAVLTALPWPGQEPGRRVHRVRVTLLLVGLTLVLAGWPLGHYVSELRTPRNETTEAYLRAEAGQREARLAEMRGARSAFGQWHLYSVLLNLATIAVVGVATGLAAHLPAPQRPEPAPASPPLM